MTPRHVAGLAVWLVVVGMIAFGAVSRAALGRPFFWASGLILALALFSAFSSLWSGSVELSVDEADRVLVYLGVFVAAVLIAQTEQRRQRFGEGVAVAIFGIAVLMLASRLLPHLLTVDTGLDSGSRLRYPLGYWNANGFCCAIGVVLALWMSRRSPNAVLRWVAIGAIPALLTALYLTYSRGGVVTLVIGALVLLAFSRDRLWMLLTLALGLVAAVPPVLVAHSRAGIAQNVTTPDIVSEGVSVVLFLALGTALVLLGYWALRALERRGGDGLARALAASRDGRVLRRVGIGLAALAIIAAVVVGARAWDQFASGDAEINDNPSAHFSNFSAAGRNEFFRVALDAFAEDPLGGTGAGTYRFSWYELRHNNVPNQDAHSLYLQALAELGVFGCALVIAMMAVLIWAGFAAWRDAGERQRETLAALLAVTVAFALSAAIDWFWQIAAVTAIFFCASGALVAARCRQLVGVPAVAGPGNGRSAPRRYGLTVVGLVVAWVTALALIGPLLVDRELDSSRSAAGERDIAAAVSRADTARSIEPWAASPYVQLGLLAQARGEYPEAVSRLSQAIDREDRNWLLYYLRAVAEHRGVEAETAGFTLARAEADRRRAQELNPEEACLSEGWEGCG